MIEPIKYSKNRLRRVVARAVAFIGAELILLAYYLDPNLLILVDDKSVERWK